MDDSCGVKFFGDTGQLQRRVEGAKGEEQTSKEEVRRERAVSDVSGDSVRGSAEEEEKDGVFGWLLSFVLPRGGLGTR